MDTIKAWVNRNVTFGLVLAICTEVPRWVFAFMAAHEPVWSGVALAVLISYATAHAWEEYFARPERLLLALNGLSLFFGVYTIAPVLYVMSSARVHGAVGFGVSAQSNGFDGELSRTALAEVFPAWFIATWAFVLSCTTFLPLIQVAVVEVRRRERAHPTVKEDKSSKDAPRGADVQVQEDDAQPEPKDLAVQLHSEGLTKAQIGERLGVHRNTVGKWLASTVRLRRERSVERSAERSAEPNGKG